MSRMAFSLLLAALAAATGNSASALESLDDATMADQVGQASGLVGVLRFNLAGTNQDIRYADGDGYGAGSTAGALLVDNFTLAKDVSSGDSRIKLDFGMDVGYNTADTKSAIFLTASTTDTLKINFNTVSLDTEPTGTPVALMGWTNAATSGIKINNGFNITLRLGNELGDAARYLGAVYGSMGYVTMAGLSLKDGDGSGEMVIDNVNVSGTGGATNPINLGTSADPTKFALSNATHANCGAVGICMTLSGQTTIDATISNIRLGSATAPAVANLVVTGLNLGGTSITVGAH